MPSASEFIASRIGGQAEPGLRPSSLQEGPAVGPSSKEFIRSKLGAPSEFAGLDSARRAALAARLLETPASTPLGVAANIGRGALQAVGDIPAGLTQIAARGARAAGVPERLTAPLEESVAEYERVKRGVLAQPGGTAGYLGGQIGTAFLPGTGVAAGATRVAAAAKPLAIGAAQAIARPAESEAARAKAALESLAFGAAGGAAVKGLGLIGRGGKRTLKRAFAGGEPIEATATRAAKASAAQSRGYILTLGEISGNKRLQALEDASENMLGGTALAKIRTANKENTNKILSRRIGDETPEFTASWFAKTADDIGEEFNAVRALDKTTIGLNTREAYKSLDDAVEAAGLIGEERLGPIVKNFKRRYQGEMTWNEYADLRSKWAKTVIGSADKNFARELGRFIGILDSLAERAAPDAEPLRQAARKYREFTLLEKSVDENGDILRGVFVGGIKKMKRRDFVRAKDGDDELIDVARTLDTFKNQIPSSGTAERAQAMKTIEKLGAIPGRVARLGAAGAGFMLGDITGAASAYAAPYAAQKLLMSEAFKRALTEKAPRIRDLARGKEAERISKAIRLGAILGNY